MSAPMPDDREMDQAVHSWLTDEDERPADRNRQMGRIMGRVDETRQRRRLWPLNPFGRGAVHSATRTEGTGSATRRSSLSPVLMTLTAVVALVVTGLLYTALRPTDPALAPAAIPASTESPHPTMPLPDPADEDLFARMENLWANDAVDVSAVMEVYAPDAVHTTLWTDRVQRFTDSNAIANRMMISENLGAGGPPERVRLPNAADGEHRYLEVIDEVGGMPCVVWIEDDRITRHDCILPMSSSTGVLFTAGKPPAGIDRNELMDLFTLAWRGDRAALEEGVSADIIHFVAWDNHAVKHQGIDEYWTVANNQDQPPVETLADPIDLPAPEGELRWTNFSDVGRGTLCTLWARDGKIARQDCIVPGHVSNSNNLPPS